MGVPGHPSRSLHPFVDARLSARRRQAVERHLLGCTRCALDVARIRRVRALLAGAPPPRLPEDLYDRLLSIATPLTSAVPASRPRSVASSVGILVAGVVLVGATGAGAVATSASAPWPGVARSTASVVLTRPMGAEPARSTPARTLRVLDTESRP